MVGVVVGSVYDWLVVVYDWCINWFGVCGVAYGGPDGSYILIRLTTTRLS